MKYFITALIIASSFFTTQAQDSCECCTELHSQFDFWVGDWDIYDTLGVKTGENTIVKLQNNCIIQENWKGRSGGTGSSYNYFNLNDSTWNQVWIDNRGNSLNLKGKAVADKVIMISALMKSAKYELYRNKITWTSNPDGTLTQNWQIIDEKGEVLNLVYFGIYKRKE